MIAGEIDGKVAVDENGQFKRNTNTGELILNTSALTDENKDIFFREAIYADSVIDLGKKDTDRIFQQFVESVATRLKTPSGATNVLISELQHILSKYIEKK
jgi:hypothetical protein